MQVPFGFSPGDARGEAPCIRKQKISPFPGGEGYPPSPLPGGKGETKAFFMQGAAPLASPRLNPRGTGEGANHAPGGGRRGAVARNPAFSLLSCPHPPNPLPAGKGEFQSLFCRGLRPRHPCIRPPAALIVPAKQAPGAEGELVFRRKTDRTAFLWAVPAAKERGDRGRGTSAFEMVLSPGAGRTSAAGVHPLPSPGHHSGKVSRRQRKRTTPPGTTAARSAGNQPGNPPPNPLLPIIFRPSLDNRTEVWYTRDTTIETR